MKECAVNRERAVVANHQMAEVAEPREGTLDFPAPAVASQRSSVLGHRFASIPAMWRDQFDPALRQPLSQRVTVVTTVGDEAQRVLPRSPRAGSAAHADRRERRFRKPRFVRGCRTKVLSQRKTLAVDHHHPLRALAPLGFSDSSAPFLAGAKLPSKKDSLHCSCFRSLSSARHARQILSQTPCSSQSRSLRQQVAGEGNSSGKSCQRAPLRRIHKMPSSTLRSEARGRPPRRREPGRGSKGRIFSHWASVNRRPYRAIGPPAALLTLFISHFRQPNYLRIQALHPVLKQLLVSGSSAMRFKVKLGSTFKSLSWLQDSSCLAEFGPGWVFDGRSGLVRGAGGHFYRNSRGATYIDVSAFTVGWKNGQILYRSRKPNSSALIHALVRGKIDTSTTEPS